MRVSSPIGELPFEPVSLHYRNKTLVMEGSMGAWPARVVIEPADIPSVLRLVAKPAAIAAGVAAAASVLVLIRRNH
ncbi:MAG: hypothetical protein WCP95_15090 [Actinomycetes bacterium]